MKAQAELPKLGWRIALAQPLLQSYHFERFVGRRRVAAVILVAKSTPAAWAQLRRILKSNRKWVA